MSRKQSLDELTDALTAESVPAGARRLARLARFMDSSIRLPGGYRIGWDGVIGLVPGVGDLTGLGLSAWIVFGAARLGAPPVVLARMGANIALESIIGVVPVVGDLFDFVFKANQRNLALAAAWLQDPPRARRRSVRDFALIVIAMVLGLVLVGWAMVAVLGAVIRAITG